MPDQYLDFQKIHASYHSKIARYLSGLAGEHEAEDLCQEVFAKVDKGLKNFRAESELSTWIYRIATNTYLDYLRSRSFKHQQQEILTSAEEIDAGAEGDPRSEQRQTSLDQQVIRKEMKECIRGYINQLPKDYRVVLLLNQEGFKNREIAEILKISLDNAKARLHRARAKLKVCLQGNCDFYLDERSELACDRKRDRD